METNRKLEAKYFHGIGSLIAKVTGYTAKYVRDVLNGEHDDRDTEAVKEIKRLAELYSTPVVDAEILQSA